MILINKIIINMKIEQRLYTESQQLVIVELTDENSEDIVISMGESTENSLLPKLFLTKKEANELSMMVKCIVDKTKSNSL